MTFHIRRVVTSHDTDGTAIIGTDGIIEAVQGKPGTGVYSAVIWATDSMPIDITNGENAAEKKIGLAPSPNGTIFRIIEIPPGEPPYMHRTDTIDYAIVLDGEIDMEIDNSEVHMKAGDVMVQRGTIHAWANREDKPCRIAFVLIDGKR
ncbi:cupin domain-containing protein [Thermodesulfobacteriota bacterium]